MLKFERVKSVETAHPSIKGSDREVHRLTDKEDRAVSAGEIPPAAMNRIAAKKRAG